jgi:hypothetical protein
MFASCGRWRLSLCGAMRVFADGWVLGRDEGASVRFLVPSRAAECGKWSVFGKEEKVRCAAGLRARRESFVDDGRRVVMRPPR